MYNSEGIMLKLFIQTFLDTVEELEKKNKKLAAELVELRKQQQEVAKESKLEPKYIPGDVFVNPYCGAYFIVRIGVDSYGKASLSDSFSDLKTLAGDEILKPAYQNDRYYGIISNTAKGVINKKDVYVGRIEDFVFVDPIELIKAYKDNLPK